MKDLVNKLMTNLHYVILVAGLYAAWNTYEEHSQRMDEINNQVPALEAEFNATSKKVKEIQDFVKRAEESKVRVEEVAKNIEAAQKQLPPEINDNQILSFFNQEMSSLNIKDPTIVPGQEVAGTYFISKNYAIRAKGTFLQFLVFFEKIGNATRIYNVKSLKLVNTESNQRGRFQIISGESSIEAFRFNPDFKVDLGFEKKLDKK